MRYNYLIAKALIFVLPFTCLELLAPKSKQMLKLKIYNPNSENKINKLALKKGGEAIARRKMS